MKAIECPNHGGAFDCTPFCELCAGDQELTTAVPLDELEHLDDLVVKYLKHLKRGEFSRAREIASTLTYATYDLDTAWMQAQKRK